jgi:hypothetical protein
MERKFPVTARLRAPTRRDALTKLIHPERPRHEARTLHRLASALCVLSEKAVCRRFPGLQGAHVAFVVAL